MLFGYSLFFFAFFILLYFPHILLWINSFAESLPFISRSMNIGIDHFISMPIIGLLIFFPAVAGPISFSTWGNWFHSFRISVAHFAISFFFVYGWALQFDSNQWILLEIILASQLIGTGVSVPASIPWSWAVFIGLLYVIFISPWHSFFVFIDWTIAIYLFVSGILILLTFWETTPTEFPKET